MPDLQRSWQVFKLSMKRSKIKREQVGPRACFSRFSFGDRHARDPFHIVFR